MPPSIRRVYVVGAVCLALVMVRSIVECLWGLDLIQLSPQALQTLRRVHYYAIAPVVLLCMLHMGLRFRRFKKRLVSLDYRVCLGCEYALVELPDQYRCPECGRRYDAAELPREWQRWLAPPWRRSADHGE